MRSTTLRKLKIYVDKYGPEAGPRLYHILQSQAAHAGVGARLRRKIEAIRERGDRPLPLFEPGPRPVEVPGTEALTPVASLPSTPPAP
jgi:hypothetical protein